MLNDLRQIFIEFKNRLSNSRTFVLGFVYIFVLLIIFSRLFKLQILDGEYYQDNYIQKTEKTLTTQATRGNIYDRNGELLAYNKLAYAITVRDNGDYKKYNDRNAMIYRLVKILNKHNEKVIGDFQVDINEQGNYYYTSNSEASKKRFLRDYYGLKSINDLDKRVGRNDNKSNITADELVDKKADEYKLNELKMKIIIE